MYKTSFTHFVVFSVLSGIAFAAVVNYFAYLNSERLLQVHGGNEVEQFWWSWNAPWLVLYRNGIGWERYDWQNLRAISIQSTSNPTRAEFDELVRVRGVEEEPNNCRFPEQSIWPDWMVFERVIVQERRDSNVIADASLNNLGRGRVVEGFEITIGLPFHMICGGRYVDYVVQNGRYSVDNVTINLAEISDGKSLTPYGVLWLGAIGNVIVYSSIVAGLRVIVNRLHRGRRIRKGLCGRCGYRMRELEVCPECGSKEIGR